MPRQRARVITPSNRERFISYHLARSMLEAGDAELVHKIPLTVRIIDKTEYREELRYQRGRQVGVSKCPSPGECNKYPDQDWEGKFELPDLATTGRKSVRCRPPRHPICEDEREFQRYKTGFLRRQSEEEADRVRLRSG